MARIFASAVVVGIAGELTIGSSSNCAAKDDPDPETRVGKLVGGGKRKESFQSKVFVTNPLMDEDIPTASRYLKNNKDYRSYLLLMALNMRFSKEYMSISAEDRAAILCSALQNALVINDWGWIAPGDAADGKSAKALLETGKAALPHLTKLLDDGNPAMASGSKAATQSRNLNYRRKDFAYRYIMLILGESPTFERDLALRDKAIETLKNKLMNEKKETKNEPAPSKGLAISMLNICRVTK